MQRVVALSSLNAHRYWGREAPDDWRKATVLYSKIERSTIQRTSICSLRKSLNKSAWKPPLGAQKNEVIHNSQHGFAVGKSLNNLLWIHCWLCFEQNVGLKTSQDHCQPEWFFVSMTGTGFPLRRMINGNSNFQLRNYNSLHCLILSAWTKWGSILKIQETYIYSNFALVWYLQSFK